MSARGGELQTTDALLQSTLAVRRQGWGDGLQPKHLIFLSLFSSMSNTTSNIRRGRGPEWACVRVHVCPSIHVPSLLFSSYQGYGGAGAPPPGWEAALHSHTLSMGETPWRLEDTSKPRWEAAKHCTMCTQRTAADVASTHATIQPQHLHVWTIHHLWNVKRWCVCGQRWVEHRRKEKLGSIKKCWHHFIISVFAFCFGETGNSWDGAGRARSAGGAP